MLTCRARGGSWPRPYVPDVDSVALPLQQPVWALTCVLASWSLVAMPVVVLCRRLAGLRPLWVTVVVNVVGVAAMLWVFRGDPGGYGFGSWAWD